MRIPDEIQQRYEEEMAVISEVQRLSEIKLQTVANSNEWLFDSRIKRAESVLSKIEKGSHSFRDMHDFYATMIVVPTQAYIQQAVEAIGEYFEIELREHRNEDPSSFVYDDTHLIAHLGKKVSPVVASPVVLNRRFEIQIHTGVQYAWWRATHDNLYKSASTTTNSWEAKRASSQAKASLELIDGILADFDAAARLQVSRNRAHPQQSFVSQWVDSVPQRRVPADRLRFVETAEKLLKDCRIDETMARNALYSHDLYDIIENDRITLIQVVLVAIYNIKGNTLFDILKELKRPVLITHELTSSVPAFKSAPEEIRVEVEEFPRC